MKLLKFALLFSLTAVFTPVFMYAQRGGGGGHAVGGGGHMGGSVSRGGASMGGVGISHGTIGSSTFRGGSTNGFSGNAFRGGTVNNGFNRGFGGSGFNRGFNGNRFFFNRPFVGFGFGFGYPFYGYPYYGYGYGYPGYYNDGYYPYDSGYGYGYNDPYAYNSYGSYGGNYGDGGYGSTGYAQPPVVINQNLGGPTPPVPGTSTESFYRRADYYLIAFNDHTIQAALSYRIEGDTIYWTTREHEERHAPMSNVDRRFTEQMNRDRHVEMRLQ